MALIICHECGKSVSTEAKTCPSCGAKVRKPKKSVGPVGILVVIVVIGIIAVNIANEQRAAQDAAATPTKTPEQLAQDKAKKAKRETQLQAAGLGAAALKHAMKDPEAFQLTSLVVKPNGTACYEYRGKNSFGATLPSEAVLTSSGKMFVHEEHPSEFVSAWNKNCTPAGGDDITDLVKRLGII